MVVVEQWMVVVPCKKLMQEFGCGSRVRDRQQGVLWDRRPVQWFATLRADSSHLPGQDEECVLGSLPPD